MLAAHELKSLDEAGGRVVVAYSGGMDSHVLLHLLHHELNRAVEAVHVNHGLHTDADAWQDHVESVCDDLGIPLSSFKVAVSEHGSLEQQARQARYQVFETILQPGDVLAMAHHQDDQIETILLNLLSGRAPMGLQGMPSERPLGAGLLRRPLLHCQRDELLEYAKTHQLAWVEDDSNQDTRHDRNYLRREVIPHLAARWPGFREQIAAGWQRTNQQLDTLEQVAQESLGRVRLAEDCLWADQFFALPEAQQLVVFRTWAAELEAGKVVGNRLISEALAVLQKESATFEMGAFQYQHFRHRLVAVRKSTQQSEPSQDASSSAAPLLAEQVSADVFKGRGLSLPANQLAYRVRQGGETLLLHGRHKRLKNLFQEQGYPPCIRASLPLIYDGDRFIGIPAISRWEIPMVIADDYQVNESEPGCYVDWQPH